MDLSLTESEQLLQDSVRSFVEREASTTKLVELQQSELGCEPKWLESMGEAGWLGALVPAELGGAGANTLETAVICETLGRGPVPGPYLASSVVSAAVIAAAQADGPRDELLTSIARGEAVVVPASTDPARFWEGLGDEVSTRSNGGVQVITGALAYVPYAAAATHFIIPIHARTPKDTAARRFVVVSSASPGVTTRLLPGFLGWNFEVALDDVEIDDEAVLTVTSAALSDALALAYPLVAAYQVGGCAALLERSIAYSNTRVQFAMPIGRFQRVQDHIVELLNACDAARWTMYEAVWQLDARPRHGGAEALASAHLAQAVASESYIACADAAHKVHGGIGVDPQYGLTLYTQMSRSLYHFLGAPRWHKRHMVTALRWSR